MVEDAEILKYQQKRNSALALGIAGLISTLLGPVLYVVLLDQPFLRRTGLIAWLLMADGIIASFVGLLICRRRATAILSASCVALALAFSGVFFILGSVPGASSAAAIERMPYFELPDQDGHPIKLRDALARGPVHLVFFRGHW